jgi:site-specific recombinase XerD
VLTIFRYNAVRAIDRLIKDPKTRIQKSNRTVLDWYSDFITAKEKKIGEGINSYRSTFEHFKTFTNGKGAIHLKELTKEFLEKFRDHLEKLGLAGPTIHKQFKNLRILLNWIVSQDEEIKNTSCL